jgi:multidrug efflux system membrane fusion protein
MWKVALCATVALGLIFGAVGCGRGAPPAGGFAMSAMVTTAPVVQADVPEYLDEIGKTSSTEVVTVEPQVSGMITERSFTDGSDLTKGQKLFSIDPRPYQAALDQAQATLLQEEAQRDSAKTDFDRDASLLDSKAISQQDYDDKKDALAVAEANVKAGQAGLELAQLNLGYCTITAPFDGRAGQRLVDAGNVVNANISQLLVIQRISPIYVDFTVTESDLPAVRQNMASGTLKVLVQTPDNPNESAEGELTFLDNTVQDGTGTIKLRATLKNEDRKFWPGQFVHVRLILTTVHDALLVPSSAVQVGQTGTYVFVLGPGNVANQTIVKEGQRQGDNVVIESGLTAGETIILSGQLMVMPGFPVTVIPAATQPSASAGGAGQ